MIDGTPAQQTGHPAGEEKEWAELEAELAAETGDDGGAAAVGDDGQAAKTEPEASDDTKQPPVPYEELERRHRQTAGALKEAREEARLAKEQANAIAQMVEELRAARQQQKAPEPAKEEPKEPDPYEDPIGYVNFHLDAIRKEVGVSKQTAEQVQQQRQQEADYKQFMGTVSAAEEAFAARTPDYHNAAKFLEDARRSELAIMFPDTPQADAQARAQGFQNAAQLRNAIFIQDAQTVAANALRAGMNPAEAYYGLAKARGYKPDATKLAKQAEQAIEMARRGKAASKTISGGGGAPDNPLSAADLADLYAEDPEEFDRQWDKMAKAGRLG